MKILVEFGANISVKDESDQTPTDIALHYEHREIVEYLTNEAPNIISHHHHNNNNNNLILPSPKQNENDTWQQQQQQDGDGDDGDDEVNNFEKIITKAIAIGNLTTTNDKVSTSNGNTDSKKKTTIVSSFFLTNGINLLKSNMKMITLLSIVVGCSSLVGFLLGRKFK